jgi:hypothetical protein
MVRESIYTGVGMGLTFFPTTGGVIVSMMLAAGFSPVLAKEPGQALHDWQVRRLMQPLPHELNKERSGSIYIYDGLTELEVETSLNAHFDRIPYMMFVGTVKTDARGEPLYDKASGDVIRESAGCGGPE